MCDRLYRWHSDEDVEDYDHGTLRVDDEAKVVIEAARKWDEHERKGDATYLQKMGEMYEERNKRDIKADNEKLRAELMQVKQEREELKRKFDEQERHDEAMEKEFSEITMEDLQRAKEYFAGFGHNRNDPDGVGEGWRRIVKGDIRSRGDEIASVNCNKWEQILCITGIPYSEDQLRMFRYRRRIESPLPEEADGVDHKSPLAAKIAACQQPAELQGKPREYILRWSMRDGCYRVDPTNQIVSDKIHVREVNAEHDAWVERLIELCDAEWWSLGHITDVIDHMKARPQ
jgi:hypothetical protein